MLVRENHISALIWTFACDICLGIGKNQVLPSLGLLGWGFAAEGRFTEHPVSPVYGHGSRRTWHLYIIGRLPLIEWLIFFFILHPLFRFFRMSNSLRVSITCPRFRILHLCKELILHGFFSVWLVNQSLGIYLFILVLIQLLGSCFLGSRVIVWAGNSLV